MSRFPTEPIGHVSPRPPIDIQRRSPVSGKVLPVSRSILEMMEDKRLWDLVKGAAEGSNVTARTPECDG